MCIKGKSRLGKFGESVLTLAVLCSYPMLFAVERGNIIILALVFTMVFVFFRNSENRVLRELSYISLAVAAAIKIYPAILGVLLLREKKFKDAARLTIYGIVMFFVPFFLFYDGVNSLKYMLEGFISVSGWDRGCGVQYSLHNLGAIVERLLAGHSPEKLLKVCKTAFSVLVVGGLLGSAFLVREEWKRILALVLIMILLPNISYTYTLIFLIVPLVLFLNVWHGAEEGLSVRDKAYAVCFFVLMVPIVTPSLPQFQDDIFPFTYGMLADYLALLTMVFLLFWDAVSGLRATRSHSGADMQHGI